MSFDEANWVFTYVANCSKTVTKNRKQSRLSISTTDPNRNPDPKTNHKN